MLAGSRVEFVMLDQRCVRFASIEGLVRDDLPLAREIWLDELFFAPWASRDAMKLAAHFMRYMAKPDILQLSVREVERECQMVRDDIHRALTLMRTFSAVEGYALEKDEVRVTINLSLMQRLRVLEAKKRFIEAQEIAPSRAIDPAPIADLPWVSGKHPIAANADEAPAPLVALIAEQIRSSAKQREHHRVAWATADHAQ